MVSASCIQTLLMCAKAQEMGAMLPDVCARRRVKAALCHTYVALHMCSVDGTCMTIKLYTLDGKVCMVVRSCLWGNG